MKAVRILLALGVLLSAVGCKSPGAKSASAGRFMGGATTASDQVAGGATNSAIRQNAITNDTATNVSTNAAIRQDDISAQESNIGQAPTNLIAVTQGQTNLTTEKAANAVISQTATNSQSSRQVSGKAGGIFGHRGGLFWFYIFLDLAFLAWLVLAIQHRVRSRHPQAP